ncbi:MAG: type III pantothenate kinase [Pseudomonadota bacterium]
MILDVDAGNSRIKWRLVDAGGIAARGVADSIPDLLERVVAVGVPDRVRVASVRSEDWVRGLRQRVLAAWAVRLEVAVSRREQEGVVNAYDVPGALGVDRWLALVAAYHRCGGACVVIDCGTALTMDIVDASGWHLGGFIVPGLSMQYRSLEAAAGITLPPVERFVPESRPGRSTAEAVGNGCVAMLAGWLANDDRVRHASINDGLFMTGGDVRVLSPLMESAGLAVRQVPELVLDGLALVLP